MSDLSLSDLVHYATDRSITPLLRRRILFSLMSLPYVRHAPSFVDELFVFYASLEAVERRRVLELLLAAVDFLPREKCDKLLGACIHELSSSVEPLPFLAVKLPILWNHFSTEQQRWVVGILVDTVSNTAPGSAELGDLLDEVLTLNLTEVTRPVASALVEVVVSSSDALSLPEVYEFLSAVCETDEKQRRALVSRQDLVTVVQGRLRRLLFALDPEDIDPEDPYSAVADDEASSLAALAGQLECLEDDAISALTYRVARGPTLLSGDIAATLLFDAVRKGDGSFVPVARLATHALDDFVLFQAFAGPLSTVDWSNLRNLIAVWEARTIRVDLGLLEPSEECPLWRAEILEQLETIGERVLQATAFDGEIDLGPDFACFDEDKIAASKALAGKLFNDSELRIELPHEEDCLEHCYRVMKRIPPLLDALAAVNERAQAEALLRAALLTPVESDG